MMSSNFISAMILAGGLSSRMGQDKALIKVEGIPLLQRVCSVAQQCTDQVYIITPWIDRYQPLVSSHVVAHSTNPAIRFLPETRAAEDITHSPLTGFLQGLSQLPLKSQRGWVLLLACDLPYLEAAVLQEWIAVLPQIPETVTACLPKNPKGWWEPLCGLYRANCQPRVAAFVGESGRSFQRWLSRETVHELPLNNPQMLINCNTPADLEAL
ncbi:MAG: molybdenum cofactor guanylyltransferase [Cyanobacteria bacterium RM1_2_2]|nr:molybdenum cofactor guanylyltransferase [Cyanobacteria bacterium RM1_2_2]